MVYSRSMMTFVCVMSHLHRPHFSSIAITCRCRRRWSRFRSVKAQAADERAQAAAQLKEAREIEEDLLAQIARMEDGAAAAAETVPTEQRRVLVLFAILFCFFCLGKHENKYR
jgi:hypothetical protein